MTQAPDLPAWAAILVALFVLAGAGITLIGSLCLLRLTRCPDRTVVHVRGDGTEVRIRDDEEGASGHGSAKLPARARPHNAPRDAFDTLPAAGLQSPPHGSSHGTGIGHMGEETRRGTTIEFRVRYAETDQMGVVYHSHYLVWCEIGRTDYARVRLVDGKAEPVAISGASILSSTTRADGFVVVTPCLVD